MFLFIVKKKEAVVIWGYSPKEMACRGSFTFCLASRRITNSELDLYVYSLFLCFYFCLPHKNGVCCCKGTLFSFTWVNANSSSFFLYTHFEYLPFLDHAWRVKLKKLHPWCERIHTHPQAHIVQPGDGCSKDRYMQDLMNLQEKRRGIDLFSLVEINPGNNVEKGATYFSWFHPCFSR